MAAKVLMRELTLRNWKLNNGSQILDMREMLETIWKTPKNGKSANLAETVEVLPLITALRETEGAPEPKIDPTLGEYAVVMESGESLQITESQYKDLKERVKSFGFTANLDLVAVFGDEIMNNVPSVPMVKDRAAKVPVKEVQAEPETSANDAEETEGGSQD